MLDVLPRSQLPLEAGTVRFGASADSLSSIKEAPVSLAVWERSMPVDVVRWLDRMPPETLPTARFVCHHSDARQRITQAFSNHAQNSEPASVLLKEDIVGQIEGFARVCGSPWIEVRLETVTGDACRRFHADNVSVRLLTTYRGPGTEWLDIAAGKDVCSLPEYPEKAVRQLPRFAVALIKGRLAKSRSGPLVLHRSPPIEGTGQTRLLLCVSDAEPAYALAN